MNQFQSIEQVVDYAIPGKEQFFSHHNNNGYRLYKSGHRFIYVIVNFLDYNVYVSSSDNILSTEEVDFIKHQFNRVDFICTNCNVNQYQTLTTAIAIKAGYDEVFYDKVII